MPRGIDTDAVPFGRIGEPRQNVDVQTAERVGAPVAPDK
jgi:hypothetical protein